MPTDLSTDPPTDPETESRGLPLSVLRDILRKAQTNGDLEKLIENLAGDSRAGGRALEVRARKRLEANRHESERLAGLLVLRDELVARGVRGVAGVDEVGVGPLAGPVVAAAVVLPMQVALVGLDDSKRVRRTLRSDLAREIREIALGVGIGEVSVLEIDQVGIYRAALEAMRRAVASLTRVTEVGHLLVDARTVPGVELPQTARVLKCIYGTVRT